jgi:hypothetical protein
LCIDFDGGTHHNALVAPHAAALYAYNKALRAGLSCYLERSGGGSGWHLWIFFAQPVEAAKVRRLGLLLAPYDALLVNGGVADPTRGYGIVSLPRSCGHP